MDGTGLKFIGTCTCKYNFHWGNRLYLLVIGNCDRYWYCNLLLVRVSCLIDVDIGVIMCLITYIVSTDN